MSKVWALHGGGDWADASAEYLILPEGLDIEAEAKAREKWYLEEYYPKVRTPERLKYLSLFDWLLKKGAREPTPDELEIFNDGL